jgi:hypothetical protein
MLPKRGNACGFGGVFKAFLASNTPASTAISRFSLTGATWVRPDGIPFVSTPPDLASDNPVLLSAPQVSPTQQYYGNSPVWTGAASGQTAATAVSSCTPGGGNSWSGGAAVIGGINGQPYFADAHYFNDNRPSCRSARQAATVGTRCKPATPRRSAIRARLRLTRRAVVSPARPQASWLAWAPRSTSACPTAAVGICPRAAPLMAA